MKACRHRLPGYRATFVGVGALYALLAASILAQGPSRAMARYQVPSAILASPHYADAITWVYVHMLVLGLVLAVFGHLSEPGRLRVWMARLLLGAHVAYTTLDFRASALPFGTGLYKGPGALAPAVIGLVVTALLAHLCLCPQSLGERATTVGPQ
ncbi:MAG: hypothetical protein HY909_15635 [Deltaproteobacteria bacterium]|nr:hypothetical protein [Deltaproteobacteria bacterium]